MITSKSIAAAAAVAVLFSMGASSANRQQAIAAKTALEADPRKPLVAHAFQDRYFPGSTFKIVTASAGLESGQVTPDSPVYPSVGSFTPPQTNRPINNFGGARGLDSG